MRGLYHILPGTAGIRGLLRLLRQQGYYIQNRGQVPIFAIEKIYWVDRKNQSPAA